MWWKGPRTIIYHQTVRRNTHTKISPIFCGPHGRDGEKTWSVMYEPSEFLAEERTDRRTDSTKNISLLH